MVGIVPYTLMSSAIYDIIAQRIAEARHVLLLTDERIDGDTLGSTMGLYHTLMQQQKKVTVFSPKPLPPFFDFLPAINIIKRDAKIFKDHTIDLMIICDCSDGVYIKTFLPLLPVPVPLVCIDHHLSNPHYGTINLIEPYAASTADVAYRFARGVGYDISPEAAQCFLTGMCTDTILFSTPNTNPTVLETAAELLKKGADMRLIVRNTMMNKSAASLRLWGLALSRLFHDPDMDATATVVTRKDIEECRATEDDIKSLSEYLNEVLDDTHETVLVYYEKEDGSVKGSLRSRKRNVAALAQERFGGGGHKLAAGFSIKNAHMEIGEEAIWRVVRNG